jgi:VIT1/CCC1 family predicted Fe2+/Mn2+ transporter
MATKKIDSLRAVLMRYLPPWLSFSHEERQERKREFAEGRPPKEVSPFVDRLVRFVISFIGGVFLVAPMVIMTFHQSQTKSLVTVSVAVVLFALILSFGIRVPNAETLISTATYAAVLVVFVGTSTSGNTSSNSS